MTSQALRSQGTKIQRGALSVTVPQAITSITATGSLATITTASAHALNTGDIITIAGAIPSAYNGAFSFSKLSAMTGTFVTSSPAGGPATTVGAYTAQAVTYSVLEEANDIKLGGISVTSIDVTHLLSTSKEFIAGMKDNGSCDIACNFINGAVQTLMRNDCNAGVTSPYQILIPAGAATITIAFSGFLTKYAGPEAKVDGKLEIQMTLKVTGDTTITSA